MSPPPRLAMFFVVICCLLLGGLDARSRFRRSDNGDEHDDDNHHDSGEVHFGYTDPDEEWPSDYPICAGSRQSPVNIELQEVKMLESGRPPLGRFGYDTRPLKMKIVNNGHSVQLSGEWPTHDTPTVYGGPLTGLYELAQVHFHWGDKNDVGSEHTVANQSFPLEMHMVHWKKAYENFTEAAKHDDGLVVLGYLMSLDKNANMGIERIRSGFSNIINPGQETEIDPFPLSLFDLDMLKEGYVTYLGSLTTPPCSESVTWLISVRVKDVTLDELESFRKLKLKHSDNHNYRPPQPLYDRDIFYIYENPK